MKYWLIVFVVAGCGNTIPAPFLGTWTDSRDGCDSRLEFSADNTYSEQTVCGTVDETQRGTYTFTANEIVFHNQTPAVYDRTCYYDQSAELELRCTSTTLTYQKQN